MHVASLHVHPLKSCAQVDVASVQVSARGPIGDRRWLAVDSAGRFITARQQAAMVGIRAVETRGGLRLDAPQMPTLEVSVPSANGSRLTVAIWRDNVDALRCDPAADAWLSAHLGADARLVYMDDAAHRGVDPAHSRPGDEVSFADAYPLLVIGQASLDDLNARLDSPVPMLRFRPNVVVAGGAAFDEDTWRTVLIGTVMFDAVKRCTRCIFTTIDPGTLQRDPAGEPLRTLTRYRRDADGVTFGMNLIPRSVGTISQGDAVVPVR